MPLSRTERLNSLLTKFGANVPPNDAWGPAGAPYEIHQLFDGRRRLVLKHADGDRMTAIGATLDEALDEMAKKLGLTFPDAKE